MKKLTLGVIGSILAIGLIGCKQIPEKHVHKINEYGECSTCGEYLGSYPVDGDNVVPILKEHKSCFYKIPVYAGHKYLIGDLYGYSYEETSWYGHSDEGYTLVAANQKRLK